MYLLLYKFNAAELVLVAIGSLLPDIDHQYSLMGRYNPFADIMKHRGFCHTIPFVLLISIIFSFLPFRGHFPLMFGLISHLVLDTLNPSGIMWLFPVSNKKFSFNICKTGSPEESIIFGLCMLYLFTEYKLPL